MQGVVSDLVSDFTVAPHTRKTPGYHFGQPGASLGRSGKLLRLHFFQPNRLPVLVIFPGVYLLLGEVLC